MFPMAPYQCALWPSWIVPWYGWSKIVGRASLWMQRRCDGFELHFFIIPWWSHDAGNVVFVWWKSMNRLAMITRAFKPVSSALLEDKYGERPSTGPAPEIFCSESMMSSTWPEDMIQAWVEHCDFSAASLEPYRAGHDDCWIECSIDAPSSEGHLTEQNIRLIACGRRSKSSWRISGGRTFSSLVEGMGKWPTIERLILCWCTSTG